MEFAYSLEGENSVVSSLAVSPTMTVTVASAGRRCNCGSCSHDVQHMGRTETSFLQTDDVTVAPTATKFRLWEEGRQVFCRQTMTGLC